MYIVASLTSVISWLNNQVQNLLQEKSRVLHRQVPSIQVAQEEKDNDEEVFGLH